MVGLSRLFRHKYYMLLPECYKLFGLIISFNLARSHRESSVLIGSVRFAARILSEANSPLHNLQNKVHSFPNVLYGNFNKLPKKVQSFVQSNIKLCQPSTVHICDGSERENELLFWLARTDPADVARVESLTFISTEEERDTIPIPKAGIKGQLGNWIAPEDLETELNMRFPGSMKGRTMYVIPFSMGPVGSPMSKIGVQLTDSAYVVASMGIMTRMGSKVLETLGENDFVKCLHSVGQPLPMKVDTPWPCNPKKTIIAHLPERNEICSFGSGYGGNSLLGKKCFALRLENDKGEKKYVAAAFPSACGKTNLAMMLPSLPGYKVTCVGDDIAWMKFDKNGQLRAINPEAGFFGVAPGTSMKTNPNAMKTIMSNTIFTNVAETDDGDVFWEGMEKDNKSSITSWLGLHDWTPESGKPAAHPNSRFCAPAGQCPIMDPNWESPEGVPIEAIMFGVPLVYEAFNWQHGVYIGASMRSEATAAAEHKAKVLMHDPFAMRPFFGYNFGHYLNHWLSFQNQSNLKLPKMFHVNWFRKNNNGKFIWPGFGENARVLDWIFRRCNNEDIAFKSAIGYLPKPGSINMNGLKDNVDMNELFYLPKEFWQQEVKDVEKYFEEQVSDDLPPEIMVELRNLEQRVNTML
ncbi:hypothetical protein KUTeg_018832 [Tegillarca granosa]|uniref:phosphoenolpyruvate carboxykinase (GTP) n=1 Tax=Tegillarca granosa TaxID=220873 RepID=A0ABQ9EAR1_TEGGR|nr:hypothetical protein KUTeg_018832 [Tegillarca granosa]